MNYNEFMAYIKHENVAFTQEDIVECCKVILSSDFSSIKKVDYENIKSFFSMAGALKLIPREYNTKIDSMIEKMD